MVACIGSYLGSYVIIIMKKILITGPESTGKSELSVQLATRIPSADWTPEYARYYLEALDRPYQEADLWHIAQAQVGWEKERSLRRPDWLFCDTGPEVTYIWSMVKYGRAAPPLSELLLDVPYDFTLLCYPDLPWTPDPLREAPDLAVRLALFDRYHQLLEDLGRTFQVVEGLDDDRFQRALACLEEV